MSCPRRLARGVGAPPERALPVRRRAPHGARTQIGLDAIFEHPVAVPRVARSAWAKSAYVKSASGGPRQSRSASPSDSDAVAHRPGPVPRGLVVRVPEALDVELVTLERDEITARQCAHVRRLPTPCAGARRAREASSTQYWGWPPYRLSMMRSAETGSPRLTSRMASSVCCLGPRAT
jgi:hypothetical protein